MSRLIIVEPMAIAGIEANRGSGVANLLTPDPKEVWVDAVHGPTAALTIFLGEVRLIDTIFLGHLRNASAGATLTIAVRGAGDAVPQPTTTLRVPDAVGTFAPVSHALFHGTPFAASQITLFIQQPEGSPLLSAGTIVVGKAFIADLGQEWGAGRQPIDTGTATPLPSGGFSMVEGVRKRRFAWTFGDLSQDEADRLEMIALALGETKPGLVVEDFARTAGLVARIRYGKFDRWKQYERRNRRQTRWEIGIEDWL